MADRTVYGLTNSENGWRMVDQGSCVWVDVPGTSVSLQIREGQPAAIMGAFAADFNAYVETLRDPDSACWTPTNSVASSNHLSGTAMDLNWNSHPFQVANAGFDSAKLATVREMLDFYEDTIFWGNDWNSPKDAMHFQMGYDTYGSENVAKVNDFIARKRRADGFSTFRRGNSVVLSAKDLHALDILHEGQRRGTTERGLKIALATALVESNITIYANERVPASMAIPHEAVGSDAYSVGIFQQQVRDTGNGWWWDDAATCMDPTLSAGLFYSRLVKLDYNGPNSPGSYAQAVQSSAFPDRYDERFAEAEQLYNRLVSLPAAPTDPLEELLMAEPVESWSIYASPGEPKIPPINFLRAIDAKIHRDLTDEDARAGDLEAVGRVARTAGGRGTNRSAGAISHAARVLDEIERDNPEILQRYLVQRGPL